MTEFEAVFSLENLYTEKKVKDYILKSSINQEKEVEFWQNYIRSIITAEYLRDNKYSEKLDTVIKDLKEHYNFKYKSEEKLGSRDEGFYLIKSFVRVSWLVLGFCERKRICITEPKPEELIVVNTDRRLRFYSDFRDIFEAGDKNTARRWERLLESVVEVTTIDHRYVATDKNIGKLLLLRGRLKFFENDDIDFGKVDKKCE